MILKVEDHKQCQHKIADVLSRTAFCEFTALCPLPDDKDKWEYGVMLLEKLEKNSGHFLSFPGENIKLILKMFII